MLKFKDLSIRHKLTTIIVATSGIVILISSLILIINEAITFRQSAIRNISVLTDVIAINSTAALSFQDPATAAELLSSLKVEPNIINAAIYNAKGDRFAIYKNLENNPLPQSVVDMTTPLQKDTIKTNFLSSIINEPFFCAAFLDFTQPVILNHNTIGLVYVRADQGWIHKRIKLFIGMTLCLVLGLFFLSYFLSQKIGRVISTRIENLADTIEQVANKNDYTVRVQPDNADELGTLMLGFNEMLEQIQTRELKLEQVSRMKSEFLANMSHELRTPLNAIIGFSELLKDKHFGDLNETQDDYINDIHKSGHHLLSLINDILDISKVESGKMAVEISDIKIHKLLSSSLTMIREKALRNNINITLEIDSTFPSNLRADERKLKQILYNLLANAAKFTKAGGQITLSADIVSRAWIKAHIPAAFREDYLAILNDRELEPKSDKFCRISVADSGIGIKAEDLKKIFTAFVQADSSLSRKYGGTGLGLALCKNFIELHQGIIWAESVVAQGSTFTLVLPYIYEK